MHPRIMTLVWILAISFNTLPLFAENEGLDKLDQATEKKLDARTPDDLEAVVKLCEEALEAGLDEGNAQLAKRVLAASAFQRAEIIWQSVPRMLNNPRGVRQLKGLTMTALNKAVEANPKLAEAWVLMAKVEAMVGEGRDKAKQHLDKAIELLKEKPMDLSNAYVLRAELQEKVDDKLIELQKAIEANSTNALAWQGKIALQMSVGKLQEAVDDAEKLLQRDESNMFALIAAVRSLLDLGKPDEAVQLLTKKIEAQPENGVFHRERARAYRRKSFEESLTDEERVAARDAAFEDLNRALEIDNNDAEALLMRGEIYFEKGEFEKANRDVADSLRISPDSAQGVLMRSMVAASQGRLSEAIPDMERLVQAAPTNALWIRQLAQYYHLDNRPRQAIRLLDELLRNESDEWRALRLRGDARLSIGDHQEAIEDYEQALSIVESLIQDAQADSEAQFDYSGLLNNLAWVLATSPQDDVRDGKRSVELGIRACEATEYKAAHILSTLAAGYGEIGDFENARKYSAQAVELESKEENPEQLEQLKKELESYKADKPWREEQEVQENEQQLGAASETIDT